MNLGNCVNVFDSLKNVEEDGIGDFFIELNLTPDECQKFCQAITEISNEIGYGTIEKLTGGGPITWRKAFIMYLAVLAAVIDASGRCVRTPKGPEKRACKYRKNIAAENLRIASTNAKTDETNAQAAEARAREAASNLDASVDKESVAHAADDALNVKLKNGAVTVHDIARLKSMTNAVNMDSLIDTALKQGRLDEINRKNMIATGLFWSKMIIAGTLLILSLNGIRKLALSQQVYNTFGIAPGQQGQPFLLQGGPAVIHARPPALAGPPLAAIQPPVTGYGQTYPQMAVVNVPYNDNLPGFNQMLQANPDSKYVLTDGMFSNIPIRDSNEVYNASRNGYRVYAKDPSNQQMHQLQTIPHLMQAYGNGLDVHIRWSSQVQGGHRYKKSHKQTRNKRKQSRNRRKQSRNRRK